MWDSSKESSREGGFISSENFFRQGPANMAKPRYGTMRRRNAPFDAKLCEYIESNIFNSCTVRVFVAFDADGATIQREL